MVLQKGLYINITIVSLLTILTACSESKINVHINTMDITDKEVVVRYQVYNKSKNDIWVCTNMDIINGKEYNVKLHKFRKIVKVQLTNRKIPYSMNLEEPVYAKFIKIRPTETYNGIIKLNSPIEETSYVAKNNLTPTMIEYFDKISIEIGTYDKIIDDNKNKCCSKESTDDVAYVNCFWARKNKADLLYCKVKNLKLPVRVDR